MRQECSQLLRPVLNLAVGRLWYVSTQAALKGIIAKLSQASARQARPSFQELSYAYVYIHVMGR